MKLCYELLFPLLLLLSEYIHSSVSCTSHYPLLSLRVYVKRAHSLLFMCRVSSHHMKMRISEFNFGCVISSLFWINSTVAQWVGLSCL